MNIIIQALVSLLGNFFLFTGKAIAVVFVTSLMIWKLLLLISVIVLVIFYAGWRWRRWLRRG